MRALRLTVRRLAAYLVDVLVLAAVLLPVAFLVGFQMGTEVGGVEIWLRALVMVSLPGWAYFILTDRLGEGRSLGKRVLGLHAIEMDGSPPDWRAAIVRTAVKLLPWELVHLAFFGLSTSFRELSPLQIGVAAVAYALMLAYLAVASSTAAHAASMTSWPAPRCCPSPPKWLAEDECASSCSA